MKTPAISIVLFLLASLFGALGQFLYQSGSERATGGLISYLANARLLGGVACYVAVMVLFVAAFKKGGALTVLYPVYATTFIFAALIATLGLRHADQAGEHLRHGTARGRHVSHGAINHAHRTRRTPPA